MAGPESDRPKTQQTVWYVQANVYPTWLEWFLDRLMEAAAVALAIAVTSFVVWASYRMAVVLKFF